MTSLIDVTNDLTYIQRQDMSDKIEIIMRKYGLLSSDNIGGDRYYFNGVAEGLNIAYKIINELDDDYNVR